MFFLGFVEFGLCAAQRSSGRRLASPPRCSVDPVILADTSVSIGMASVQGLSIAKALDQMSVDHLEMYCRVKGMRRKKGSENGEFGRTREEMEEFVERYIMDDDAIRKSTKEFRARSDAEKIRALHRVACGEGAATYIDPKTEYTVFSAFWHLKRGSCCGVVETDGK